MAKPSIERPATCIDLSETSGLKLSQWPLNDTSATDNVKKCARGTMTWKLFVVSRPKVKLNSIQPKKERTEKYLKKGHLNTILNECHWTCSGVLEKNFVVVDRKLKRGSLYVFIHKTRARPMLLM